MLLFSVCMENPGKGACNGDARRPSACWTKTDSLKSSGLEPPDPNWCVEATTSSRPSPVTSPIATASTGLPSDSAASLRKPVAGSDPAVNRADNGAAGRVRDGRAGDAGCGTVVTPATCSWRVEGGCATPRQEIH